MNRYFDPLPTKLPMKSQTRGRLLRELETLPSCVFPTIAWTMAQANRIEAIKRLLDEDLQAQRERLPPASVSEAVSEGRHAESFIDEFLLEAPNELPGPWAAWQEAKSTYYSYLTLYPPDKRTAAQQAEINRLKKVMNEREYAARCLFYGHFG